MLHSKSKCLYLTSICITYFWAALASAALPKTQHDTLRLEINYINGLSAEGAIDSAITQVCEKKYRWILSQNISVKYWISSKQNRATMLFNRIKLRLTPLGIPDTYSFSTDKVPASLKDKGLMRVIFTMEDDFTDPVAHIIATGVLPTDRCYLSSKTFSLEQ